MGKDVQPLQSVLNYYNSRALSHERPRSLLNSGYLDGLVIMMISLITIHTREPKHNLATYD